MGRVYSGEFSLRLEDGEWWEVGGGTQTEIGDYKSHCLASDVNPVSTAKV